MCWCAGTAGQEVDSNMPGDETSSKPPVRNVGETLALGIQGAAITYGVVVTLLCAGFAIGTTSTLGDFLTVTATAFALALTGAFAGGFLGLLFGMPRQSENVAASSNARYEFNSNLLKVSDWVTTIIVGLSLVSLGSVPGALDRLSEWIAPALGSESSSGPFGVFIASASLIVVFMLLYIWTTVPLRSHLENDAFDTEQQWASLLGQVADNKAPEEISEALKTLTPAVLDRIQSDPFRTPPLLQELAAREQSRRISAEAIPTDQRAEEQSTDGKDTAESGT
jgi:hypothetical protein